jgi:aromatic ring-opening dioxygenase catalytic subunit (LigB family)
MSKNETYLEGKLSGMFNAYEAFDVVMIKLKNSIDNVWMIHDQEDFTSKSAQEHKEKLMFAHGALSVLMEMFNDEYDSRLEEIRALKEEG